MCKKNILMTKKIFCSDVSYFIILAQMQISDQMYNLKRRPRHTFKEVGFNKISNLTSKYWN